MVSGGFFVAYDVLIFCKLLAIIVLYSAFNSSGKKLWSIKLYHFGATLTNFLKIFSAVLGFKPLFVIAFIKF